MRSVILPFALLLGASAAAAPAGRYIVALHPIAKRPAVRAARELPVINGFAADLSDDEVAALRQSSAVRYLDPVVERHLLDDFAPRATASPLSTAQSVPYGIDLVHAPAVWPYSRGANINIVIIDTGITPNHPDLTGHVGGYNALTHTDDFADDHGHGTHVAGTIAAVDNGIGVVGVAPEARIWSVKALDAPTAVVVVDRTTVVGVDEGVVEQLLTLVDVGDARHGELQQLLGEPVGATERAQRHFQIVEEQFWFVSHQEFVDWHPVPQEEKPLLLRKVLGHLICDYL